MEALRKEFAHLDLTFSIGGQISFDVFPRVRLRAAPWLTAPLSRRQRGGGGQRAVVCSSSS